MRTSVRRAASSSCSASPSARRWSMASAPLHDEVGPRKYWRSEQDRGVARMVRMGTTNGSTSFLTETAKYTFCHVNIVPSGFTTSIFSLFRLYCNCLSRTDGFTKFTRYTSFLAVWISS